MNARNEIRKDGRGKKERIEGREGERKQETKENE